MLKPGKMPQKPWRQLAFVLGEAALSLVSSGILFIIISRVGGPELFGTYALAFGWLMLFQGVSTFGIPEFLMREVGAYGRDAAGQVVHAILLGLASGILSLCLMLAAVHLFGYSAYVIKAITIAGLALIPAFLNLSCRAVFLALRQMHLTFLGLLVEVVILMSASLYLLLSGYGAVALIVALVVAKFTSASVALVLLCCRALPVRLRLNLGLLTRTARTVFTFGIGNVLGVLTMRINLIMVSVWVDIASVGRFAAATKIMEIGMMLPSLIAQLLMSRISYSFNTQGDRDPNRFAAWYRVLFAFIVPICVGVWVFAGQILEILFGRGFENAVWILRILSIYLLIESADVSMSVILKAAQRQREDVTRLAFNPLTNIALSLVLLPIIGSIGAAIGRAVGVGASAILRDRLIGRELNRVNWFSYALKPALISIGVGSVCYSLLDVGSHAWLLLFYVTGTAVLLSIWPGFSLATIKDMMSFGSTQD